MNFTNKLQRHDNLYFMLRRFVLNKGKLTFHTTCELKNRAFADFRATKAPPRPAAFHSLRSKAVSALSPRPARGRGVCSKKSAGRGWLRGGGGRSVGRCAPYFIMPPSRRRCLLLPGGAGLW